MQSLWRSKRFAGIFASGVALAVPLGLGIAPSAQAAPAPDIKVTQNSSDAIVDGDGISCNDGLNVSDNQYYRRFDLSQYGAANGFKTSKLTFGVEVGDATNSQVPGAFSVYALDHSVGASFTKAQLGTALATVPVNYFTATGGTLVSAAIAASVPAGKDMVIEASVAEATTDQVFYPGANESAETGPTYLASAGCGIDDPTPLADLGPFDGLSIVFFANGKTTDCSNAEAAVTKAEAAAAAAATAVTTATSAKAAAHKKVAKAKKKLKKAKKSHNAKAIKKAKKKLKKAKKADKAASAALAAAQAAKTAADAAVTAAMAQQTAKCAQPALPTPRPVSSGHAVKAQPRAGMSLSASR